MKCAAPRPWPSREHERVVGPHTGAVEEKVRRSEGVREGRVELPRPFGHRILRLLRPGTTLRLRVVLCRLVSPYAIACRSLREQGCEQDALDSGVSRLRGGGIGGIERVPDRLFEGEEAVLHVMG